MTLRRLLGMARDALLLELALYRSLGRWVAHRPDTPPGASPIGYAQLVVPMLWLWILGSAVEVVVVEVVLQNIEAGWAEAIRVPLLVVGIWGVLWMLGMLASYRVRPHLLIGDHLQIRNGARTWVCVPLDSVTGVRTAEHQLPGVVNAVHREDGLLLIGVSSRTNLELTLRGSIALSTYRGDQTVDTVGLWVDEPRAVTALLASRISARP